MRWGRLLLGGLVAAVLMACSASPASTTSSSVIAASSSSSAESKLRVTVPALGGATAAAATAEPAIAQPSSGGALDPSVGTPSTGAVPADALTPADTPPSAITALPADTAPAGTTPPATVAVELVGCDGCEVIATHPDVTGAFSAALITSAGRATLLSLDSTGAVIGILNVPYGASFPAPADGLLACGPDGRCVVVAAQPDGRAILSAFELTSSGAWRDLSGASGFVSATAVGQPVEIDGSLAVAIQVSDGVTTVWAVLSWNGELYGVIGCTPDAPAPDLSALSLGSCLS